MLEYAFTNKSNHDEETVENVKHNLMVLRNEMRTQMDEFGDDKFPQLDKLYIDLLDSATFQDTQQFIGTLRRIHVNRRKKVQNEKEKIIKSMTNSPKKVNAFNKLKQDNVNDQVNSLVFDNKEKTRVLEYKGKLIQQIYPIYADPQPENYFDFRTLFYLPKKYFAGNYY